MFTISPYPNANKTKELLKEIRIKVKIDIIIIKYVK
jgi:hypothetical protein